MPAAGSVRDAGLFEIEARDVRRATERVEDLVADDFAARRRRGDSARLSCRRGAPRAYSDRVRDDVDAFFAEISRERVADVVVALREQVTAANQHRRFRAHAREELAELAGRVAAAEHDDRIRNRPRARAPRRCRRSPSSARPGSSAGATTLPVAMTNFDASSSTSSPTARRVGERKRAAPKIERKLFDPLDPVVGESLHELALSSRDERHVDGERLARRFPALAPHAHLGAHRSTPKTSCSACSRAECRDRRAVPRSTSATSQPTSRAVRAAA